MPVFGVSKSRHLLRMEDDRGNLLSSQMKVTNEGDPDPAATHLSFLKVVQVRQVIDAAEVLTGWMTRWGRNYPST